MQASRTLLHYARLHEVGDMVVLKDQDGSNRAFGRLLRLPAFAAAPIRVDPGTLFLDDDPSGICSGRPSDAGPPLESSGSPKPLMGSDNGYKRWATSRRAAFGMEPLTAKM